MTVAVRQTKLPILAGILAILIGIVGAIVAIVGLLVLLVGLHFLDASYIFLSGIPVAHEVLFGFLYLLLGIIMLAVARGLWDLESWALWTTGIVVVIELLSSILEYDLVLILVFGLLLVYLFAVRTHFT